MAMRKSGPLDAMVGARVRMLRVNRGISQTALAERIGVTFQQLQKYEQGADRVGVSRLAEIASVLDVSVDEFFESSRVGPPGLNSPAHLLAGSGAWRVLKAHARTPGPRVRSCIAKLVESVADRTSAPKATVARPNIVDLHTVDLGGRRKFPSRG
jgi:transcriptional regulator with XRE-family HTH domain